MSAGGDEINVVLLAEGQRSRLVFRQLPATQAITSVINQGVLHIYADATDWRLDALTEDERRKLAPPSQPSGPPTDWTHWTSNWRTHSRTTYGSPT